MKETTIFVAAFMLVAINLQAPAQTTPKVTQRQKNQQARIKEGIKSGELTRPEAAKLEGEQAKVQAEKRMAKADGKVTPAERAKLRHDQNKASRHIYKEKHDREERK